MNKSSNLDDVFPESCGQVEPRYTSEGGWTCEGKLKSAEADCRGDGIQPLLWNMYDRTWLRAF